MFAVMLELYPLDDGGGPRYRMASEPYTTRELAQAYVDDCRRQNLPFKNKWIVPFDMPDTEVKWFEMLSYKPTPSAVREQYITVQTTNVDTYRWKPYKPEGARQMGKPGRWQKMIGRGDFHDWQNYDPPFGDIDAKWRYTETSKK